MRKPADPTKFLQSKVPRKETRAAKRIPNDAATAFFHVDANPYYAFRMRDGTLHFENKNLHDYMSDFATHVRGIRDLFIFHIVNESVTIREVLGITDWKSDAAERAMRTLKVDVKPYTDKFEEKRDYLNGLLEERYKFDFADAEQTLTALIKQLKEFEKVHANVVGAQVEWRTIVGGPNFLRELAKIYDLFQTFFTNIEAETGSLENIEPFKDVMLKVAARLARAIDPKVTSEADAASQANYWGRFAKYENTNPPGMNITWQK